MILGLLHFFFLEEFNLAFGKWYLLIFGHLKPTSLGVFVHACISLQSSNDSQTGVPQPVINWIFFNGSGRFIIIHLCSYPGFLWVTWNSWPRVNRTNPCNETGKADWPTRDWILDIWSLPNFGQIFTQATPREAGFKITSTVCLDCLCTGRWHLATPSPWESLPKGQNKIQKGWPSAQSIEMAKSTSCRLALIATTAEHIFHTPNGLPCLPAHPNPVTLQNSHPCWFGLLWTQVSLSLCSRVRCQRTSTGLLFVTVSHIGESHLHQQIGTPEKMRDTSLVLPR